jgi:hypothetical protein
MGKRLVNYYNKWESVKGYHLTVDVTGHYEFMYIFDDYETCMNVKNKIISSIASGSKLVTYSHTGPHAVVPHKESVRLGFWGTINKLVVTLVPNTKFEDDSISTSEIRSVCVEEKNYDKQFNYMYIDMTEEEIDKKVLQWHETNFPAGKEPKLHEYLGMTEREYSDYVEGFYIKVFKKSSE